MDYFDYIFSSLNNIFLLLFQPTYSVLILFIISYFISHISCDRTKVYAVPITHVLNAEKLSLPTTTLNPDDMIATQIQSRSQPDKVIESIGNSIDTSIIWDSLNKISVGKVLKVIYDNVFPNGFIQQLSDLICHCKKETDNIHVVHESSDSHKPVEYTTHKPHETIDSHKPHHSIHKPHETNYWSDTTDSHKPATLPPWNTFSHYYKPTPPTVKPNSHIYRQFDWNVDSPDDDISTENLKQEPFTGDYIDDEPVTKSEARSYLSSQQEQWDNTSARRL